MLINALDNVEINLDTGHKTARENIKKGEKIIKYGFPIGTALTDIKKGEAVHTHNLATALSGVEEYSYEPDFSSPAPLHGTFSGYNRPGGQVGIRNDIWIIPTVGCVGKTAQLLAEKTGAKALVHNCGCSQLGEDFKITGSVLKGLVNHPNAGGVLVIGLGCENNNIKVFKEFLGEYSPERVKFLNCQEETDEIEAGKKLISELESYSKQFVRTEIDLSKLKIGLKCGGSDGYSGITANPLVGRVTDRLIAYGGTAIMTEVPEMFGAERILFNRCETEEVFNKAVSMINNFKEYFIRHNQPVYENPSPGNKEGGITTLEEKSLGCVQKGGISKITDVLSYGDAAKKNGLNLLNGPGNDQVSITNLCAAGAHMILFTTGRGTPLGAAVPTIKIASNEKIAEKKPNWIDFDSSGILKGNDLTDELFGLIKETADGKRTKNEINGFEEISIFRDGVIL